MTNELYDTLYDSLKPTVSNIFRNKAQTSVFPYTTIKIDTLIDTYPTCDYMVNIAVFDKDGISIKPLESRADSIIQLLNNHVLESSNYYYHFKLSLRQFINAENLVGTQAIEMQFLVRSYKKEV